MLATRANYCFLHMYTYIYCAKIWHKPIKINFISWNSLDCNRCPLEDSHHPGPKIMVITHNRGVNYGLMALIYSYNIEPLERCRFDSKKKRLQGKSPYISLAARILSELVAGGRSAEETFRLKILYEKKKKRKTVNNYSITLSNLSFCLLSSVFWKWTCIFFIYIFLCV